MASTLDYLVPELRIQDPCGHETMPKRQPTKRLQAGPKALTPTVVPCEAPTPAVQGSKRMPCFDLDRAAGAWELGMGVPRGSNGTSRCLSRTAVFATRPNRQAARDVTRPTRHITLQLEHRLRLSPSTEAHRTEPASRCCTSGVPDSMGTDAERASSTRMRKSWGRLGTAAPINGPPAPSPSVLTLAPCCVADTES